MSEVATQFRVLDLCGSMCADQHTQQQTNVAACVQISTPSNRLMWQHVCRSAHPATD